MIFRKSKLLLTTIFFLTFFQSSYSNEIIIPKKKPAFKSQVVVPPLKPGTINEKKNKLEQLRALENNIKINVALAKSSSIGVDTEEDFVAIKKIMEYKSK